ncbi:MAG: major outer membrane protein [Campylobacteraceae bacterium]|jgi:hypothetical protein|nr:major outer membrane protein [Campylobacteraceae bacterium]
MKLVKLSLAAVIAAGAMTTFASATSLEEAIKGVDVSGMARVRFYHQSDARYFNAVGDNLGSQATQISGLLNINAPIAENFTFGTSLATDGYNTPANAASGPTGVEVDKFFFQYAAGNFVLKAGKIEIPTPWTEAGFGGSRGNGLLGLYTGVENWTLAAAYYNQINGAVLEDLFGQEDLMAVAAIGGFEVATLQGWVSRMTNVFDYNVFGQVGVNLSGFNAVAQANYMRLDKDLAVALGTDKSGIFMGFTVGYENENFFVTGGFTKSDSDMPIYALTADNDGFIKFGQQLYLLTTNTADTEVYFLKAGAKFNKFGVEAGYGVADIGGNVDVDELYGLVSYQIAKNFGVDLYYSVLGDDVENNELRLQVEYNF